MVPRFDDANRAFSDAEAVAFEPLRCSTRVWPAAPPAPGWPSGPAGPAGPRTGVMMTGVVLPWALTASVAALVAATASPMSLTRVTSSSMRLPTSPACSRYVVAVLTGTQPVRSALQRFQRYVAPP